MKIDGYVWDNESRPIAGVNVQVIGEGRQTTTNASGYFSITVNSEDSELRFSHAGYDYDTVRAGDFESYIELWPSQLQEVEVQNNYRSRDNTALYIAIAAFSVAVLAAASRKSNKKVNA